jgi:apolipoprotein N-acyltransferase
MVAGLCCISVALLVATALVSIALRSDVLVCALLGSALSIADILRELLLPSFPWLYVGYTHLDSPFAALLPYVGVQGLTWWVYFAAFAAAALLRAAASRRVDRPLLAGAVILVLILLAAGHAPIEQGPAGAMRVALMQTAVPTKEKFRGSLLGRYIAELSRFAESHDADLIIAPETTIPVPLQALTAVQQGTLGHAVDSVRALLFGIFASDSKDDIFNSAVLLQRAPGTDQPLQRYVYIKQHLAPFGEYSPPGLRWLTDLLGMPMSNLRMTEDVPQNFRVFGITVIPSVCLDLLYGDDLRTTTAGPRILVNISNMAFFQDPLGPRQFLQIARARAMEQKIPVVMAANFGPTAAIDASGKVDEVLAPFAAGALDVIVRPRAAETFYARHGNLLAYAMLAIVLTVGIGDALLKFRKAVDVRHV